MTATPAIVTHMATPLAALIVAARVNTSVHASSLRDGIDGPDNRLSLRDGRSQPHIGAMHFDLSDDEAAALTHEHHQIVENDRYPFSPRIRTLRAILAKLRPEPVREPLPPPKVYAPPRVSVGRKRRAGR
jgi:hypothetical protein